MKYIRFLYHRIHNQIVSNKFGSALRILSLVISSLMFIYVYGNTIAAYALIGGNNEFYRQFSVSARNKDLLDYESISALYANWPNFGDWNNPYIILVNNNKEDKLLDGKLKSPSYVAPSIYAELNNRMHLETVFGSGTISNGTDSYGQPEIIIPNSIQLNDFQKRDYRIGNKTFSVIGQHEGILAYVISCQTFQTLYSGADQLNILFPTINNDLKLQSQVQDYISSYFPDAFIQPPFYNGLNPSDTTLLIGILAILYMLSLISLNYLSQYFYKRDKASDQILWIMGCPLQKIRRTRRLESLVYALFSTFFAILIHLILYKPVFLRLNLSPGLQYRLKDYGIITVVVLLVNYILAFFNNLKMDIKLNGSKD